MKYLHNIDKSGFHRGEYVGYADGVWIIRKTNSSYGNWVARKRDDTAAPAIFACRLSDMSDKLAALEKKA